MRRIGGDDSLLAAGGAERAGSGIQPWYGTAVGIATLHQPHCRHGLLIRFRMAIEACTGGAAARRSSSLAASAWLRAFSECRKPVIGAVNGFAVTGGFELALACDFLYASENAKFADTHARVGLLPGWGLSQKLPRLVGINRAREISFSGNYFSAREALEWGLVNSVYPQNELLEASLDIAHQISTCLPDALYRIKAMMNEGWEMTLGDGLAAEGRASGAYNPGVDFGVMKERLAQLQQRSRKG